MSRTVNNKIKEEILEKVTAEITANGLNNLSLRDIAKRVGISARMLIYHFGTYDGLIQALFMHLSVRHKKILQQILEGNAGQSLDDLFHSFIEQVFTEENRNYLVLFLELYTKGVRDVALYHNFFNEVLYKWIDEVVTVLQKKSLKNSEISATVIVALFRGLMLDWLASGDRKRIVAASRLCAALISTK